MSQNMKIIVASTSQNYRFKFSTTRILQLLPGEEGSVVFSGTFSYKFRKDLPASSKAFECLCFKDKNKNLKNIVLNLVYRTLVQNQKITLKALSPSLSLSVSLCLCLCLYLSLSVSVSLCLFVSVSLCLSVSVSVSVSLCLSLSLFSLCFCLCLCLSLSISVFLSLCLSLCLSLSLSLSFERTFSWGGEGQFDLPSYCKKN